VEYTVAEREMLAGSAGPAVRHALEAQVAVGRFFGAQRFVEVTHAHVMADYEVMSDGGLKYLQSIAEDGAQVQVQTTRNAHAVCEPFADRLRQSRRLVDRESEVTRLLSEIGVIAANTCIPYESGYRPKLDDRVAWGDTGAACYANGVLGARTNFEAGPAALWAALTGRTPEYGLLLDERRLPTARVRVGATLSNPTDWAVLGALIGEQLRGYASVPSINFDGSSPSESSLKGFAAALASYGSIGTFHLAGVSPAAYASPSGHRMQTNTIDDSDVASFYARTSLGARPDLIVFTAPQLSGAELTDLATQVGERQFDPGVTVIITTSPRAASELRNSSVAVLRSAGALVLDGTCWYLMDIPNMRDQFGWRTILTPSPKLANIVLGSGYLPVVRPVEVCIETAVSGRIPS
jgi:predicted aconitase